MMRVQDTDAVIVRDAYKRYSIRSVVLNGLSMTVKEGTIYGLLGPSGCGKTTLLSCIVGMKNLDSGTIAVSVKHKVEVGYMPQDISLNMEFTVNEVFHFYGRIYGISFNKIEQRGAELLKFLQLPPMDRMIGNCSGGQQRRISMAVTLLHDPKLLILDEPTVGVDPLLSNSIWEHFMDLVNVRGKTIIITTHYIEEARFAHNIALMRGGVLLAEEPPSVLMERYHCNSLEAVFLKLSEKQEDSSEVVKPYPKENPNIPPLRSENLFVLDRFKAQLIKNFNWTKRNLPVTLFVVCLPALLFVILAQLTAGDGGEYPLNLNPIAVVNLEADCRNTTPYLKLWKTCLPTKPISCRYLDHLDEVYDMMAFETVEEAVHAVKKNRAMGVLKFERNFSVDMMERLVEQTSSSAKALNGSTVDVWLDMSEFGHTIRSVRELGDRIIITLQDIANECGFNPKMATIPIDVNDPIYESRDILQTIMAAYFNSVAFYTTTMYTSTSIVTERTSGLFERSQVAGLTMFEIICAQVVMQLLVVTLQNTLSFTVLYGINGNPMYGSMALCIFMIYLTEICGMTYGFLLSIMIHVEKNVAYAGIFTVLTLFMMTGTMWPIEGMHWLMRPFSSLIPVTFSSKGYFNISMRGWGIDSYGVYMGVVSSLVGTAAFILLSVLAVKFKVGSLN